MQIPNLVAQSVRAPQVFEGAHKGWRWHEPELQILQLMDRCRLCGSPTDESLPGWREWPGCDGVKFFGSHRRMVVEDYKRFDHDLADLLDHLLVLDPKRRFTAEEALDHQWFWSGAHVAAHAS